MAHNFQLHLGVPCAWQMGLTCIILWCGLFESAESARAAACRSSSELQQYISITAIMSALTVLRGMMVQAAAHGVELLLPQDIVVAQRFAQDAPAKVVAADAIPDGWLVRA